MTRGSSPLNLLARARAWQRSGRTERAHALFESIASDHSWMHQAHTSLADMARDATDWPELERVARRGLENQPEDDNLHKALLDALVEQRGVASTRTHFGLSPQRLIDDVNRSGPIACTVVRNEELRLPRFLEECRLLGVRHHIVVDNGSTDRTMDVLRAADGVELWTSEVSFRTANFGSVWFDLLLRGRFEDQWVLMLDADELLCYPDVETQPLEAYCSALDRHGYRAAGGILIDMYSDSSINDTVYQPGENFLDVCPYFDRRPFTDRTDESGPFQNQTLYEGGPRQRIFPADDPYWLTKTPLIRYNSSLTLVGGQHFTSLPADQILDGGCAVLHFKFISALVEDAAVEVSRAEHSLGAAQYVAYHNGLARNPVTSMFDPGLSERFENSAQLVELGLLRSPT